MRGSRARRLIVGAFAGLLAAPLLSLSQPTVAAAFTGGFITNETVTLGVHPEGHLNLDGGPASLGGETTVGLRYNPTGAESTAPGCTCEGWGAGDAVSGVSGSANDSDGIYDVEAISFTTDGLVAQSVTQIPNSTDPRLEVTHSFAPSAATPYLYEVDVTIQNLTGAEADLRYRRTMDWDVEPTPFDEYTTIDGNAAALRYSSTNGFDSSDPLDTPSPYEIGPGSISGGPSIIDSGPNDHGAMFDFGFDDIPAGESIEFSIFYGAAGTETDALNAIASVGAEVWSFGQPSTDEGGVEIGRDLGEPNTFIFAFSGVGGAGLVGGDRRPPVFLNVFQDPGTLPPGGGDFTVTSRLRNVGTTAATGNVTRIELGPGLTLTSGANPADLGTINGGGSAEHTWGLTGTTGCLPFETSYDVFSSFAEMTAAGETERVVRRSLVIPGTCGSLTGFVTELDGTPLAGAHLAACPTTTGATFCPDGLTNSAGFFSLTVPDGTYTLTANPPAGTTYEPRSVTPLTITASEDVSQNIVFSDLEPIPAGTTIESRSTSPEGIPVVYWRDDLTLTHAACPGGTGIWEVFETGTVAPVSTGVLTEDPAGSGAYTGVIPAFFPEHGYKKIVISIDCPDAVTDTTAEFNLYIDPSGWVRTPTGEPIEGATMTLYRSDVPEGPFTLVPDGSAIMSPANRLNPMATDSEGHFGWDTLAGFYKVRAEKAGCVSASTFLPFAETGVLVVPPPVLDIDLRLQCGGVGYVLAGGDGGAFTFGGAAFSGSGAGSFRTAPVVGTAAAPGGGYVQVDSIGGVFAYGTSFPGSLPGLRVRPSSPIVGIVAAPGGGYWLVASDGAVFALGGAPFLGSLPSIGVTPSSPIAGLVAAPGGGYWLVGRDGGTFAFGGAPFLGSLPALGHRPSGDIVGMAAVGAGYVLVSSAGGVYAFETDFFGSLPGLGIFPGAPIVGIASYPGGYWVAGRDGGVYTFGNGPFLGSMQSTRRALAAPIVGIAAV